MAKQTIAERRAKGLYWDRVWKINEGCTKVSPGCENCWSEAETAMRQHNPNEKISSRAKLVLDPMTDKFDDIHLRHDNLDLPLRTKKPSVFAIWNDLFHEDVSEEFIDEVYRVIQKAKQHTFLILTKRADRMAGYLSPNHNFQCPWGTNENVYHGVTICNQVEADRKIPQLSQVPGKTFLSIEPMIGPINLNRIYFNGVVDQVLLGGESGKKARPMHPEWVRTIRDQCQTAGVPFMFKQWGEWKHTGLLNAKGEDIYLGTDAVNLSIKDYSFGLGTDPVRVTRIGKKKAGRTLDGKIHEELIWDKKEK